MAAPRGASARCRAACWRKMISVFVSCSTGAGRRRVAPRPVLSWRPAPVSGWPVFGGQPAGQRGSAAAPPVNLGQRPCQSNTRLEDRAFLWRRGRARAPRNTKWPTAVERGSSARRQSALDGIGRLPCHSASRCRRRLWLVYRSSAARYCSSTARLPLVCRASAARLPLVCCSSAARLPLVCRSSAARLPLVCRSSAARLLLVYRSSAAARQKTPRRTAR